MLEEDEEINDSINKDETHEEESLNPLDEGQKELADDADEKTDKKSNAKISGSKLHEGEVITFDDNNEVKERAFYIKGKKEGENRVYKKGLLAERKFYKDGVLDGFVELYDKGIMKLNIQYKDNLPNGIGYFFLPSGIVNAIGWYKNGLLEGPFLIFNMEGRLAKRSIYKENQQEGQAIVYHPNGMIFEIGIYRENKKDGKWVMRDDEGNLLQTTNYNMGVIVSKKVEKPGKKE